MLPVWRPRMRRPGERSTRYWIAQHRARRSGPCRSPKCFSRWWNTIGCGSSWGYPMQHFLCRRLIIGKKLNCRGQSLRTNTSEVSLGSQCFDFDIAEVELDSVIALLLAPLQGNVPAVESPEIGPLGELTVGDQLTPCIIPQLGRNRLPVLD